MSRIDIGVLGAGSFGTCLAKLLSESGHRVTLWCRSSQLASRIVASRENHEYLPGHKLDQSVEITGSVELAVRNKHVVLGVTPSHAIRSVLGEAGKYLDADVILVNASKGLEQGTLARIDQIYDAVLPAHIARRAAYLSGPTFAVEIAKRLPSAIAVAGYDRATILEVQGLLSTQRFRIYTCNDVIGVLVGGALKNIVAIATGISDGLGFGDNARAALLTRALAEITRLGVKLGADPMTFAGLSGMGDLILTCCGDMSRNRRLGMALAQGQLRNDIEAQTPMIAEGVRTTQVAYQLANQVGVDAPIITSIHRILFDGDAPSVAISGLMGRALKDERD